jgi:hypothetical protein
LVADVGRERQPEVPGEQAKVVAVRVREWVAQVVAELEFGRGAADGAAYDLAAASEPIGRIETPTPVG